MTTLGEPVKAHATRAGSSETETAAQTIQKLREEAEKMTAHSACARRVAPTLNAVARAYWSKRAGKPTTGKGTANGT